MSLALVGEAITEAGYPRAAAVEAALGDPGDPANPTGFAAAVGRDRDAAAPDAIATFAREVGLHLSYVPVGLGGTLTTFDETLARVRMVARRDASVMPATMFSVTAVTCLLAHGSAAQQRRAVDVLRAGGSIAFALSEPASGSDLLANSGTLVPAAAGWSLDGTKWLVGQGSTSELVYVVARTAPRGPAAFSAVLLERDDLAPGTVTETLHAAGLTGVGLDTLAFRSQPVAADALVGGAGEGLEATLKSMQIVRLLSTAASLACADVAVRTTAAFLADHQVAGAPSLYWAPARRDLASAAASLIVMDAVSLAAARMVHVRPGAFTLPSAVVKRIATEGSARILSRCADLQASRSVLSDGPDALLSKVRRDVDTIRHIDTSPAATLRLLAGQLTGIAATARPPLDQVDGAGAAAGEQDPRDLAVLARLEVTFCLAAALPGYRPDNLDLATRDDDVVTGLSLLAATITAELTTSPDPLAARAAVLVTGVADRIRELLREVRVASQVREGDGGLRAHDAAARFALLYAAAVCVQLWWWNRTRSVWAQPPGSLRWLVPALAVLAVGDDAAAGDLAPAADLITELGARALLYSAVPVPLAAAQVSLVADPGGSP